MFPFSRFVFSKYNSFPRCHKFACALLFKCPMSFFPIAIKLTTAQVEGEVMCNSIMAVAHRVMLTCDLVYNRCHCDIKQHLSSIWKLALETGTTGASLGSTWRSSMSSRRSTPPSGCTSTSCATNQTLPMGSWQSTGVFKRDPLVDLLISTGSLFYDAERYICSTFKRQPTDFGQWTTQALGPAGCCTIVLPLMDPPLLSWLTH